MTGTLSTTSSNNVDEQSNETARARKNLVGWVLCCLLQNNNEFSTVNLSRNTLVLMRPVKNDLLEECDTNIIFLRIQHRE